MFKIRKQIDDKLRNVSAIRLWHLSFSFNLAGFTAYKPFAYLVGTRLARIQLSTVP